MPAPSRRLTSSRSGASFAAPHRARKEAPMRTVRVVVTATLVLFALAVPVTPAAASPDGQLTWALHFALAPTWFDPAETSGIITPYVVLYALHDAMVKPLPGTPMAPALAESWAISADGLVFDFVLRKGVRFHNCDPVTADDVKFSFFRSRRTECEAGKRCGARTAAVPR